MRRRRMVALALDPNLSLQFTQDNQKSKVVVEEIEGLIRVYKNGNVERPIIIPFVDCAVDPKLGVTCKDVVIDSFTNIWARFYVPNRDEKLPLLVYFHGGGFCVGSAAWSCYHEFLSLLASRAKCMIMSVNYRLAPENPLPAAYEDGLKALMYIKQETINGASTQWWSRKCNFSCIFLGGDSAGANIAYNVAIRLNTNGTSFKPLGFKGNILIQPFFGGDARTKSETNMNQSPCSALSLVASDTYWRLSLPRGANRDHPWCNPWAKGSIKMGEVTTKRTMVCISQLDILKDRNMDLCVALASAGNKVEKVVFRGVGHAFQVLNKSEVSLTRTHELMCHIKTFIAARR